MHLVTVPNPPYHPRGDFALGNESVLHVDGTERLTLGSIGLYDTCLFASIAPSTRLAMTPLYHRVIAEGRATGERFDGRWENVGVPIQLAALDAELAVHQALTPSRRTTVPPSSGGPTGSPAASDNQTA